MRVYGRDVTIKAAYGTTAAAWLINKSIHILRFQMQLGLLHSARKPSSASQARQLLLGRSLSCAMPQTPLQTEIYDTVHNLFTHSKTVCQGDGSLDNFTEL